mmetsp:Transcript_35053/g.69049  ORF Transcript_35053/g.69049 Transcript_35053/m.69049 type:complete len:244 (+) Transcript_35053:867-1598(+)
MRIRPMAAPNPIACPGARSGPAADLFRMCAGIHFPSAGAAGAATGAPRALGAALGAFPSFRSASSSSSFFCAAAAPRSMPRVSSMRRRSTMSSSTARRALRADISSSSPTAFGFFLGRIPATAEVFGAEDWGPAAGSAQPSSGPPSKSSRPVVGRESFGASTWVLLKAALSLPTAATEAALLVPAEVGADEPPIEILFALNFLFLVFFFLLAKKAAAAADASVDMVSIDLFFVSRIESVVSCR